MLYDIPGMIDYDNLTQELFNLFNQYVFDLLETEHFLLPPKDKPVDEDEDNKEIERMLKKKRKAIFNTAYEVAVREFQDKYDLSEPDLDIVLDELDKLIASFC